MNSHTSYHLIWLLFWFSWSCFTTVDQSLFPEMNVLSNCALSPCQLLSMSEEQIDDGFILPPEPVTDDGEMTRLMLQHCVMPTYQFIIQVAPDQPAVTHQCTSCFQGSVFSLSVKKRGNLSLDYSSDLRLTTYVFFFFFFKCNSAHICRSIAKIRIFSWVPRGKTKNSAHAEMQQCACWHGDSGHFWPHSLYSVLPWDTQ